MPELTSKIELRLSWLKSVETTASSVYPRIPLSSFSEAALIVSQMSLYSAGFSNLTVRSTTDTFTVGTRKAIPVNFPFREGITFPTALAAPVLEGMRLLAAARPARQSFPPLHGPSTVSWVAVIE